MKRTLAIGAAILLSAGLPLSAQAGPTVPTDLASQYRDTPITNAQFTIQLGASDRKIRRNLRAAGYTEIEIVGRRLARATAQACKDGKLYRIEIRSSGRIRKADEIGRCKRLVTIDQAEQLLAENGYRRIVIEENGNIPYIAIACKQGERTRLHMNKFGEITKTRDLGPCRDILRPDDIRVKLREDGYDRIRFTDRQLPRYVAEACRNGRLVELRINRRGKIRDSRRIGRCDPPIRASQLADLLGERGFDRIEVVDRTPPRFTVEACRERKRVEVTVGKYGKVLREFQIGRCLPPMTRADLLVAMRKNNYRRVKFNTISGDNYETEACRDRKRYVTRWSKYGEQIRERERGDCVSPRLEEIADRLANRGMRDLKVYVEGCRRGRKVRITLDEFTGDRLDRERIGRC